MSMSIKDNLKAPKTIVLGSSGFIGSSFSKRYKREYPENLCLDHRSDPKIDLLNPSISHLNLEGYQYVMIASAIPNIAFCEKNPELSYKCNVLGTLELGKLFVERGLIPIFFSSDYVFDGKEGNYTETSKLKPLNEYGRQKAILEEKIPKICKGQYLIIRLSKVFGHQKGDKTLLNEIAFSLINQKPVKVAFDQCFCPIFIDDVVEAVISLQKKGATGLFNLGGEKITRYDLATNLCVSMNQDLSLVKKISLEDLCENFLRPKNTSLLSNKLVQKTGLVLTPIFESIQKIAELYF